MTHAGVNTMLALELLADRAITAGDLATLGICAEAWERGGWCIQYLSHGHDDLVWRSRYRKNRAKLRHQADALLAAIPHFPLDERGWHHLTWASEQA